MHIHPTEIRLSDLRFRAYHGVLPQERVVGNNYCVNLCLTLSAVADATYTDQLEGTVNYAEAYQIVQAEMAAPSALLEHVAQRILTRLFNRFDLVEKATVEVIKINPPFSADGAKAAVCLTATR